MIDSCGVVVCCLRIATDPSIDALLLEESVILATAGSTSDEQSQGQYLLVKPHLLWTLIIISIIITLAVKIVWVQIQ